MFEAVSPLTLSSLNTAHTSFVDDLASTTVPWSVQTTSEHLEHVFSCLCDAIAPDGYSQNAHKRGTVLHLKGTHSNLVKQHLMKKLHLCVGTLPDVWGLS